MRARNVLAGLALLAATSTGPLAAQSLSGTWQLTSEGRRGPQTITLTLVQDGSELSGTVALRLGGRRGGGGGGGGMTVDIEDGTVDGDSFSFSITLSFNGNSFNQSYSGTVDGDTMEGTIQGGRGGGRPFTGERTG